MAKLLLLLTYLLSFNSFGNQLQSGDILLQPLKCWSCSLIEQQENSKYSHIGIVVKVGGITKVAEAYGSVRVVTLNEFLKKTKPNEKVTVKRLINPSKKLLNQVNQKILSYIGLPYDRSFLWDNIVNKKEAIYCSELLFKSFNPFYAFSDLAPKVMLFDINPDLWDKYFRGNSPRGELGISPEDFNQSTDFEFITEL
jgi:uncharacterized protein YycO